LAEATIEAYHGCFFDVRDRLQHDDWILRAVILAPGVGRRSSPANDAALKLFAYLAGPSALEEILGARPAQGGASGCAAMLSGATDLLIDARKHLLAWQDAAAAEAAARENLKQGARRRAAQTPQPLSAYEANVQEFLKGVTMRCGDPGPDLEKVLPALRPYINSAVELRADEMNFLAAGGELPYLAEHMEQRLPPPRRPPDAAQGGFDGA